MTRKIAKMHEMFGFTMGEKCKTCSHLKGGVNEYRKCEVYGDTRSEATDWALKYDACGLWNKPYSGDVPIVRLNGGTEKKQIQVDGQIKLEI